MLHLLDRFLTPLLCQVLVSPIVKQPVVQPVLVDGGQLVAKRLVEKLDDSYVTFHDRLLLRALTKSAPCRDASKKKRTAARAGAPAHLQARVVKVHPQRASRTRNRRGSRPSRH